MRAFVVGALAAVATSSGCAVTVDTAYLLGDGRYSERVGESRPLPQTVDRIEYEAEVEPDGSARVACFARTRQVKRAWHVTKTYRYRGGFDKDAYLATTMLDVIFGALTAGVIIAACNQDDTELSCWNAVYAAPFAADLGYSLLRYATAQSPVLIGKSSSTGTLELADEPVHEQPTACESLASLWLGAATGPSDLEVLRGHAEDASARALADGAIELILGPARHLELTPELAERWALHASLHLFALDRNGTAHPVATDRCALLRPLQTSLSPDAQGAYQRVCVPSAPPPR